LDHHDRIREELRPYYLNQRTQDRIAIRRARHALTPDRRRTLFERLIRSFFDDGVRIALRSDVSLLRQALRGFHMLEHPDKWLARPRNLAIVLGYWMRGPARNAEAYPPKPGPKRAELLKAVSVDAEADLMVRARAA
jgi:hypothetical protein